MGETVRVLLADDHPVLRSGLEALLSLEDDVLVVGHASTGEEAVEKTGLLRPDVVVMDLAMPVMDGLEATRRIMALDLGARVLVLTSQTEEEFLLPVLEAVINAFQAIEETESRSGHIIRIHACRELTLDDTKRAPFEAFSVSDTGIGFTDANYESFNTVDSPYKAQHGGKGLGRFLWLKAFERVEIDRRRGGSAGHGLGLIAPQVLWESKV